MDQNNASIAIVMGSSSDLNVMQAAIDILKEFDLKPFVKIVSAHRTPEEMLEFAKNAKKNGYKIIIAGAGGAAHLPGMIASATILPVIGVPVKSAHSMQGLDSLLSIVQMPAGVPVATMSVDGAQNAGLLAIQILATNDEKFSAKLEQYKLQLKKKVQDMNTKLSF